MERTIYLKTMSLEDALALFKEKAGSKLLGQTEQVPVDACHGRITAEAVYAVLSNPNYNACAMDGIAVRSAATTGTHERNPVLLQKDRDFVFVDTGDVLHAPYDSVIMIEDVEVSESDHVIIRSAAHPWQHVRMIGEDIVTGDMLATSNHPIMPEDIAAFVAGGITMVAVHTKPKVAIIPTGTEIVDLKTEMKPGDILDSNSRMLAAMTSEAGGDPLRFPIVPDNRDALKQAIMAAIASSDLVITIAGSSAGSEDFTVGLIRELGEVWVHGIDIKPGKPAILGAIDGKPVIGVPGYPVSAYMTYRHFVMPLIRCAAGYEENYFDVGFRENSLAVAFDDTNQANGIMQGNYASAILTRRLVSSLKHKEFVRVQVARVNGKTTATPLARGAGSIMSLVRANGILTIPREVEGLEAGTAVRIALTRPNMNLDNMLSIIGSHDLLLDWLADLLASGGSGTHLLSAHVGSLGGILALKRGEAHLAPIHLLDPETGSYNLSYVTRYFPDEKMVLIRGIRREQGFYSRDPLPASFDLSELSGTNRCFINRQKGSGTRLLVDHLMKTKQIPTDTIRGYETEVLTHTGVALAVKSGNADIGVGIHAVASQMGLCYTPIGFEDYDFLLHAHMLDEKVVMDFLEVLESKAFHERLTAAGGYTLRPFEKLLIGGGTCEML